MLNIAFEINGRKVRPNQMGNELEKAMLKEIKDNVSRNLRNVRDPETGERPTVKISGRSLYRLKIEVTGSERVVDMAKKRLR